MDESGRFTLDQAHRHFAQSINGEVWELLGMKSRTPEQNERMLHASHASLYHWLAIGTPVNRQRGEWMCAHVNTVLGHADPALRHATRCMELTEEHRADMKDFDLAYAHEGLARAQALAGLREESIENYRRAAELGGAIEDEEDRAIFMGDLHGGEWYGVGT